MAKNLPTAGQRIIAGLAELHDALSAGADLAERFTVRQVEIVEPKNYGKSGVRRLRDTLGMSQAVFAAALGVSAELVRPWEIGKRPVGAMAARLLEIVESDPGAFRRRVMVATKLDRRSRLRPAG
jgi:putative transcriptional regulator